MNFFQVWLKGYLKPHEAFAGLKDKPLWWGLSGVLICWGLRDIFYVLPMLLSGAKPFVPSYLNFLSDANYYKAEIYFMPLMGLVEWLATSSLIYVLLRLFKGIKDFDAILNYGGMAAVIVAPPCLVMDWILIAFGLRILPVMAVTHSVIVVWSVILGAIAFKRLFNLKYSFSAAIIAISLLVGVLIGALFSR